LFSIFFFFFFFFLSSAVSISYLDTFTKTFNHIAEAAAETTPPAAAAEARE